MGSIYRLIQLKCNKLRLTGAKRARRIKNIVNARFRLGRSSVMSLRPTAKHHGRGCYRPAGSGLMRQFMRGNLMRGSMR